MKKQSAESVKTRLMNRSRATGKTMQETIDLIRALVEPIVEGLRKGTIDDQNWSHTERIWK